METFSLDQIPFSRNGSFLLITSRNSSGSPRLLYKTCSGRVHNLHDLPFPADEFFELALIKNGQEIPYTWEAQPDLLSLSGPSSEEVSIVFADQATLQFHARNTGLRLMPSKVFPVQYSPVPHQIYLIDWFARGIHMFHADENTRLQATVTPIVTGIEKHWGEFPCTITFEPKLENTAIDGAIRFSRYESFWEQPPADLALAHASVKNELSSWMQKLPSVLEKYQKKAELAWFLLWNCQVPTEGTLTRPAIYMSKFWMNGIWAWDNLFNALALSRADHHLAWDQLMLFFDYQEPNGMIPDMITDLEPIYGFTKPPIQGWAILKLVDRLGVEKSLPYLRKIYEPLSRLTRWWYTYRDFDQDGIPQYFHGNDSGWDNATVFDQGEPIEGADLGAYMVFQCECLSFIADAIGRPEEARQWKARAQKQISDLLVHSVSDGHFISPVSGTSLAEPSQSLINYLPLILGHRLPARIREALINDLRPGGPFLTEYGLASEPPSSVKYMHDGYWRGPIWAASTYLVFDGLLQSGETSLAALISERFCDMCLQVPGFWENYDALTGQGLRCPGYSWTASIFLLLAEWLAKKES
jgi:glycogen debranching enzyme